MPSSIGPMHPHIRQRLEQREEELSPHAAKSRLSRGRERAEEPCPMRTDFQRDRDRIIHCKSFRRLMHKTQVFIAPTGDHYRTRLTHTLEVSQIARAIARALNLNEDLTEAISLGHDLGHTPFGHVGEDVLNELYPQGFRHNEQSLRVVQMLERDGAGLNLTWEVRDGILNHSKAREGIRHEKGLQPATLEGWICKIADAVAYINHDVDDAIRAGIIAEADLPPQTARILGSSHRQRIDTLIRDIVEHSWGATGLAETGEPAIAMGPDVERAAEELRQFLFEKVYNIVARDESERAREVVKALYNYFTTHEDKLPPECLLRDEGVERRVVDYISGMTDRYANETCERVCPITR